MRWWHRFSIRTPAGAPPGRCALIEPVSVITESYGVLIGRTLVDTSSWLAEVLVINPGSEVVVLPPFSCVGDVVEVSAVTVARTMSTLMGLLRSGLFPHI